MFDVSPVLKYYRQYNLGEVNQHPGQHTVALWRCIIQNHLANVRLWQAEDWIRKPGQRPENIARLKRIIDRLNHRRNAAIQAMDLVIRSELLNLGVVASRDTPSNSETVGMILDRLSILSLRSMNYRSIERQQAIDGIEDLDELNLSAGARCELQISELTGALERLCNDLSVGRKRHFIYYPLKVYGRNQTGHDQTMTGSD